MKAKSIKQRIQRGDVEMRDVKRRLAELAFGSANDCARLVQEKDPDMKALDLCLLAEIKRTDKGGVEVKLVDRLAVLELLAKLTREKKEGLGELVKALGGGEEV